MKRQDPRHKARRALLLKQITVEDAADVASGRKRISMGMIRNASRGHGFGGHDRRPLVTGKYSPLERLPVRFVEGEIMPDIDN